MHPALIKTICRVAPVHGSDAITFRGQMRPLLHEIAHISVADVVLVHYHQRLIRYHQPNCRLRCSRDWHALDDGPRAGVKSMRMVHAENHSMNQEDVMHDAERLVADLRDHLARHDKRIAFLFGAGTSCAVRVPSLEDSATCKPLIPDVAGLTRICEQAVKAGGADYAKAWDSILSECQDSKRSPSIEDVLSRLRMMLEAIGASETLAGLCKSDLSKFEDVIRRKIARVANPETKSVVANLPHRRFARWLIKTLRQYPVEIFTVNYDILFELALETERVPIFDGFVGCYQPFFHPDSLRHKELAPGDNWTRLWKMHGSVTWRKEYIDGRFRVIRGNPDQSGEMILPSFQKYDESRQQPYVAFTDRLARFLELDDALLIVCGFGFGDQHINNLIFEALENRPRTHVYALQYAEHDEDTDLVKRSYQRHNMIVIGPETGIIGGRHATWGAPSGHSDVTGVFEATTSQQESEGNPDDLETLMTPVKMNICDFARFCDFLESMTPG